MGADEGDLPCPGSSEVAEGARFETPTAPEARSCTATLT